MDIYIYDLNKNMCMCVLNRIYTGCFVFRMYICRGNNFGERVTNNFVQWFLNSLYYYQFLLLFSIKERTLTLPSLIVR